MRNYKEFCEKMVRDGRFATVHENGKIVVLMLFSVCNDPDPHLNNIDHEFIEHNANGKILVIEDLICANFKWKYIKVMKDIFYKRFPQIEKTMWRRYSLPKDRIFTYNRRSVYAVEY